jgi:hypothetical protein
VKLTKFNFERKNEGLWQMSKRERTKTAYYKKLITWLYGIWFSSLNIRIKANRCKLSCGAKTFQFWNSRPKTGKKKWRSIIDEEKREKSDRLHQKPHNLAVWYRNFEFKCVNLKPAM